MSFIGLGTSQAQTLAVDEVLIHSIEAIANEQGELRVSGLVSVLSTDGKPILELNAENFAVRENGSDLEASISASHNKAPA
jgi:hypothetical protein